LAINKLHVERAALQASERDGRCATRATKSAPDTAKTSAPPPPKTAARANARAPDAAENIMSPPTPPGETGEKPATEAAQTTLLPPPGMAAAGLTHGEVEAILLPPPGAAMRVFVPVGPGGVDEGQRGKLIDGMEDFSIDTSPWTGRVFPWRSSRSCPSRPWP
jgi:hypothetical protein